MNKDFVTIEDIYRIVGGNAQVSIGLFTLPLMYRDFPAVFAWNSEKQRELVFALLERQAQPEVFEVCDYFYPSPLGKFADTDGFDNIDDLAAYLDAALATCPRCGGTGEILYHYSNEAGHLVSDVLPCPVCAPDQDKLVPKYYLL